MVVLENRNENLEKRGGFRADSIKRERIETHPYLFIIKNINLKITQNQQLSNIDLIIPN